MSKKTEAQERFIFVKDATRTKTDFKTHEEAVAAMATLELGEEARARIRYRQRTGHFDVVVKVKTAVKAQEA
jgi:hypothetical protein